MCFTVNVNIIKEELERRYNAEYIDRENYRPSYYYHAHSLPSLPIIQKKKDGDHTISLINWGLIPAWVKSEEEANKIRYQTFNARAETLADKPSFSEPYKSGRCIVPVSGFFEWQHTGTGKKPWYIYNPSEPIISLAGLCERWELPGGGKSLKTFTIVTTEANELLSEIHNSKKRMPLVLTAGNEEKWLSDNGEDEIEKLMKPLPDKILTAHRIGPLIGNTRSDRNTPDLIKTYSEPEQTTLF